MRSVRRKVKSIAGWLGICALILNALVPIHLAFDLADALDNGHREQVGHYHHHGSRHELLAALVGHRHIDDQSQGQSKHPHLDCAVCDSLGAIGGFAPVSAIAVPAPALVDDVSALDPTSGDIHSISYAAYRSRAPPEG